MLKINDQITGTILTLAFGGQGILRHEGIVVFVPYTAPGDEVRVRIKEAKKSYASGELLAVIKPSPERIQPRCPYFGVCGGCQLQHISYKGQLEYKKVAVEDSLKRIGGLTYPPVQVIEADPQWGYRKHILLHLRPQSKGYAFGYISTDNTSLVIIDECKIFIEQNTPIFKQLRELLERLDNVSEQSGKAWIIKTDEGQFILDLQFDKALPKNLEPEMKLWKDKYSQWKGILASSYSSKYQVGTIDQQSSMGNYSFKLSPRMFIQNHPQQSLKIYQKIQETLQSHHIEQLLDLYCGMGVTTLMASKSTKKVVGVDSNKQAIEMARFNAEANKCDNVEFILSKAEQVVRKLIKQNKPDCILVNPPRTGLDESVVQVILETHIKHVIYVSCMPTTLARDLKKLSELYEIKECVAYDMFPQTAHVETFVFLTKIGSGRSGH
jgi:23S rRNA (uracil1939-C5)-methyltransferase